MAQGAALATTGFAGKRALMTKRTNEICENSAWLSFFTDYNWVEQVMLGTAILVALSGIMFDSSRFAGTGYITNSGEYDGLTIAVCITLIGSIVYIVFCLIVDATLVMAPDCFTRSADVVTRRMKVYGKGEKGKATTPELEYKSNPMQLSREAQQDGEGRVVGETTKPKISAADVGLLSTPPDADSWSLIRQAYVDMSERLEAMAIANREMEIAVVAAGGQVLRAPHAAGTKKEMGQVSATPTAGGRTPRAGGLTALKSARAAFVPSGRAAVPTGEPSIKLDGDGNFGGDNPLLQGRTQA
jgi:hypothetical protein